MERYELLKRSIIRKKEIRERLFGIIIKSMNFILCAVVGF